MEDQQKLFVFASPEIQLLLADNQVDLADLLKKEGISVSQGLAQDPAISNASIHKDPATVIFASAALALSLTPIITKVIAALSHKSVVVHELILIPVEDSEGNIVYDQAGQPILRWVRRTRIVESSEQPHEAMSISLKGPFGWEIQYSSTPQKLEK